MQRGLMRRPLFLLLCSSPLAVCAIAPAAKAQPSVDAACVMPAPEGALSTYPVRLEIRGGDARALGSGVVTVSHLDGRSPISVDCAKPRVIMRLAPGSYMATVDAAAGRTRTLRFRVLPSQGARTLVLRFPSAVAELTAR
jgi:hypothetical protein